MPVDRGAIDAQLREIGEGERWWEKREFRDLPHILQAGEQIRGLVSGKLLGRRRPWVRLNAEWMFVATDQRLICLRQERFARKQVDISPGQILRVQHSSGLRGYQIVIWTPSRRYRIRIPKEDAFRFSGALAPLMPNAAPNRLSPELESLSWLPGISTVASMPLFGGIVTKVAMLSPPDAPGPDRLVQLEMTVERLQSDVERLHQQVEFLEELLEKRADLSGLLSESTTRDAD